MRILAVGAHPDDIDAMVGGTLIRLAQQGHEIHYLICTDGSRGTADITEVAGLTAIRQAEQREASKMVGSHSVFFLDHIDGELTAGLDLRRDIVRVIRTVQPDIVLAWDPTSFWVGPTVINHTDHRTSGKETLDAVYPGAGHATAFPELGLGAWSTRELWLYGSNSPTVFVDIKAVFDQKVRAMKCHVSQHYLDDAYLMVWLKDNNDWVCRDFQNPVTTTHADHPQYVESFRRLRLDTIPGIMDALDPAAEP